MNIDTVEKTLAETERKLTDLVVTANSLHQRLAEFEAKIAATRREIVSLRSERRRQIGA